MRLQPRGYEGIMGRVEEIQAKVASIQGKFTPPPEPKPQPRPFGLNAAMPGLPRNGAMASLQGGFAPLDPTAPGVRWSPTLDRTQITTMVQQTAARHGLDPHLFESLVEQESQFDPSAVSSAGAQGLTQLMPGTARMLGVTDPFDPAQNLDGGARYLSQMLKQFGGDTKLALAAYNAGPGAVRKFGGIPPYKETQNYVDKILTRTAERAG